MASGYLTSGHEAPMALDGDAETSWQSQCDGCRSGEAWLGARLQDPKDIRCVAVQQGAKHAARTASLQVWEDEWREVTQIALRSGKGVQTFAVGPLASTADYSVVYLVLACAVA